MLDTEPLIIVGSSVRAAAQSAKRSGFDPWCIDQFGDRDLAEVSTRMMTIGDWPNELQSAVEAHPNAAWCYTGALENSPELISHLAETRLLLGCNSETLIRLRDPAWLSQTLAETSLPNLPIGIPDSSGKLTISNSSKSLPDAPLSPHEWIIKPLRSAAGLGVQAIDGDIANWISREGHYLQQQMEGRVVSGLYLSTKSSVLLLGMSEQLCRGAEAGEFRYVYSGSLGPLSTNDIHKSVFEQAQCIGSSIVEQLCNEGSSILGLFGIDFVLDDKDSELWTLEVNPRYTASAELYEHAFGWPLIKWHVEAYREAGNLLREPGINACQQEISSSLTGRVTSSLADSRVSSSRLGKLIVYAERDFTAPDIEAFRRVCLDAPNRTVCQDATSESHILQSEDRVDVADIPQVGTLIQENEPICTLLTRQDNLEKCRSVLTSASHSLLASIDQLAD